MGNQLSTHSSSNLSSPPTMNIKATQIIDACGQSSMLNVWQTEHEGNHLILLIGTTVHIFRHDNYPPSSQAPNPTQPTFSATISGIIDRTARNTHFLIYNNDLDESSILIVPLSRTIKTSWRMKLSLLLSRLWRPPPASTYEHFSLSPIHHHITRLVNTSSLNADSTTLAGNEEDLFPKCSI